MHNLINKLVTVKKSTRSIPVSSTRYKIVGYGTEECSLRFAGAYNTPILFAINTTTNAFVHLDEDAVQVIITKKLFAYKDSQDEIHWNTIELSPTQRKSMGLERTPTFDKEFEV